MQQSIPVSPLSTNTFKLYNAVSEAISYATGQLCILKPEVAILLELHQAEHGSVPIKASVIGLASGIPQSTAIRYLKYLEECGLVIRHPHLTDNRVSFVRLAPALVAKLDRIFLGEPIAVR